MELSARRAAEAADQPTAGTVRANAEAGRSLIDWKLFGRVPQRTHHLAAPERLNPPLKHLLIWRTNTTEVRPFGKGGFYSSPAIAFGKVYAARDDGTVYGFRERAGRKSWSFDAGAAVYGSPTLASRNPADPLHRLLRPPPLRTAGI